MDGVECHGEKVQDEGIVVGGKRDIDEALDSDRARGNILPTQLRF